MIGARVARVDALQKVTGAAKFGADLRPANMLYGKLLRSPYPHARILNIDTRKAEKLPGVKAVVTASDIPGVGFGFGPFRRDKHIFAIDKVRYLGDELAAVAAVEEEIATEALELIQVDYQPLDAVFDPEEALKSQAPRVHEDLEGNIIDQFVVCRGDISQGFQKADLILEETFRTQRQHQGYLEPVACLAVADLSGNLEIHGPFKDIFTVRAGIARCLGLPEEKVRAHQLTVGGGFGAKGGHHISLWAGACLLARKSGRPVIMETSREEEFLAGRPRVPAIIRIKLGVTREGKLTAKESRIIADAGAYCGPTPLILETMGRRPDNIYRLENVRNEAFLVHTNQVPTGPFRGFGNPQATFALESILDMVARELDMDPAELRLNNATRAGDTTVHGWQPVSCGLSDCIVLATQAAGWKKKDSQAGRGLGVACMIHVSGRRQSPHFYGSRCLLKITEDGKVNIMSGEGEVGQGWYTVASLIAAQELGVALEDVQVVTPDTRLSPPAFGPFSDRTTILGGNAVKLAAADAKEKLLQLAAEILEAAPADLEVNQGKISVMGAPGKNIAVKEVARRALERPGGKMIWGLGDYDPPSVFPDPKTRYGNVSTSYTFAAQVAEVKVDQETGKVTLLSFVGAHDLGRAINPLGAEGQVEGATTQGLGFGLMEEMNIRDGIPLNADFLNYRIPTSMDAPTIQPILVETHDPFGPYGAKGVAEPGLVPTAAAITNAIYDAVRVRPTSLPLHPAQLLQLLEERGPSQGAN